MSISLNSAAFLFSTPKPFLLFFPQRFLLILFRNCSLQPKLSSAPRELCWGFVMFGKKQNKTKNPLGWSHLRPLRTGKWLHFQNTISKISAISKTSQHLPVSLCSVGRGALLGSASSFLHHAVQERGEKKIPQHPTHFFGFSFFPF